MNRLDANDWLYFLGLLLLALGLAWGVSIATALSVVGAVLVVQSTARAYFMTWLTQRRKK